MTTISIPKAPARLRASLERVTGQTVRRRLLVLVGVIGAVWAIGTVISVSALLSSKTSANNASGTFDAFRTERNAYEGWLFEDDQTNMFAATAASKLPNIGSVLTSSWQQVLQAHTQAQTGLKILARTSTIPSVRATAAHALRDLVTYTSFSLETHSDYEAGHLALAMKTAVYGNANISNVVQADFNAMAAELSRQSQQEQAHVTSTVNGSLQLIAVLALVSLAVATLVTVWIIRSITGPIRKYVGFAGSIAAGDLSGRLHPEGQDELAELGRALDEMAESLGALSTQVRDNAEGITDRTGEILQAVAGHSAAAAEQSAAIAQTAAAVEQIRAAAEQTARKATDVTEQAHSSVAVGEEGSRAVEAIVGGMAAIETKVGRIAQDITSLAQRTQQISAITQTVNDLADQSNVLALNAMIEAVRAGEQGKSFGVVADEVRTLAEQSKQATDQVEAILHEIQVATDQAVAATREGTAVVREGGELARRAGEVIAQMTEMNSSAALAAEQIAASAQQQNAGMDQIATAMQDTTRVTADFVSGTEQSRVAAEQLESVARELAGAVANYRV